MAEITQVAVADFVRFLNQPFAPFRPELFPVKKHKGAGRWPGNVLSSRYQTKLNPDGLQAVEQQHLNAPGNFPKTHHLKTIDVPKNF